MSARRRLRGLLSALALASAAAVAAPPTSIDYTTVETSEVSDVELAEYWRLESEEIRRYRRYMALEGRYYYRHLDPVMVLGLIETNPDRRQRYAEQYLLAERRRVDQQLSFSVLVAQTQLQLFGPEALYDFSTLPGAANSPGYLRARAERLEPLADGGMSRPVAGVTPPSAPAAEFEPRDGDTIDLLVEPDCRTTCYQLLAALLETPAAVISIYGHRFADPEALAAWLEEADAIALDDPTLGARLQLKRFDPLVFADMPLSAPLALLRRDGVVVGARR